MKLPVTMLLLFVCGCATPPLPPAIQVATITITTDPPGADVYINKEYKGKSPLVLERRETEDLEMDVSVAKEEYRVEKPLRFESGDVPREVNLTLNGQMEIGAFHGGQPGEPDDFETGRKVYHKLSNPFSTIVIYDASGSMRWPLAENNPEPRFLPGQAAIAKYMENAGSEDSFGLIVFGHRQPSGSEGTKQRATSCKDIETVYPLAKLDLERMKKTITGLTLRDHKGDTPLEGAIRQAAAMLQNAPGKKTIILITDGQEECGGKPELAAKEAARLGIRVYPIALGSGVNKEGKLIARKEAEIRELLKECANASGGLFFDARNAGELYKAMVMAELAAFTFTVKDGTGKEVFQGKLGDKSFLDAGQYEIVFDTDKPFSERVEVKPAQKTKINLALSSEGNPEIQTVSE